MPMISLPVGGSECLGASVRGSYVARTIRGRGGDNFAGITPAWVGEAGERWPGAGRKETRRETACHLKLTRLLAGRKWFRLTIQLGDAGHRDWPPRNHAQIGKRPPPALSENIATPATTAGCDIPSQWSGRVSRLAPGQTNTGSGGDRPSRHESLDLPSEA